MITYTRRGIVAILAALLAREGYVAGNKAWNGFVEWNRVMSIGEQGPKGMKMRPTESVPAMQPASPEINPDGMKNR